MPTQYGGLSVDFCECNPEFTVDDPVTEITVKPGTKQTVEIIINEVSLSFMILNDVTFFLFRFFTWYLMIDRNAH